MASTQLLPYYEFDADYLHRLNARDPGTQDHFVAYFSRLLQMKLRRRSANLEQINDVRQETFARVLAAIRTQGRIRQAERLGAFVIAVCNNVLSESFRSNSHCQPIQDLLTEPQDDARSPEAIVSEADAEKTLSLALCRLPQREKTVLSAIFLEQKERDEVCKQMGITRANLRLVLHRGIKRLRRVFVDAHKTGGNPQTQP